MNSSSSSKNKISKKNIPSKENLYPICELKIAVLGKTLVGKSALTFRFINDKFPNEHDTTIEDQFRVNVNIETVDCRLEILDTAGQDDYQTMLDSWIGFAEGFLLVYAIDDRDSFNEISVKYKRIIKNKSKDQPCIVIVGNKCDLEDTKRKVDKKEGEELAKSFGVHFMEVSALERINVKEGFLILAKELLYKKGKLENPLKEQSGTKKRCYCF